MLANDKYHIQAIKNRRPLIEKYDAMTDIDKKITLSNYGSKDAYDKAYERALQDSIGLYKVVKSSEGLFTIQGSDHMKFIDLGLFIGVNKLRQLIGIGGKIDPDRCLEITEALTRAFFDKHLKKGVKDQLFLLLKKYPELLKVELK